MVIMSESVEDLLSKKGVEFLEKGNDYVVCCLSPDHSDAHPSLRIDKDTGMFNCFSCGFRGDVFTHYEEYRSRTYDLFYEVEGLITNLLIETRGLDIPESAMPFIQEFRGIKAEVYEHFNAFTHTDQQFMNRVVFPIYDISGKIQAFIGRYTHSKATPKYRVEPPQANLPIYPVPQADTVVFVEGLFDALNLIDKGMDNVACIFGTQNITWKTVTDKLSPLLHASRIALLFDNDTAGIAAARKLKDIIESKTDLKVVICNHLLPDGEDPGDLDARSVGFLKTLVAKELRNTL